eukprot:Filipodium_phascolosomae@DN2248_c0_g1_i1.p2
MTSSLVNPSTNRYYEMVAKKYNNFYHDFGDTYYNWLVEGMSSVLEFQPDDQYVDLGGGTGYLAQRLYDFNSLKKSVYCVDPNEIMIKNVSPLVGV